MSSWQKIKVTGTSQKRLLLSLTPAALGSYKIDLGLDFGLGHWCAGKRAEASEDGFEFGCGFASRFILSLYK